MDPIMIAVLVKYGLDAVLEIVDAFNKSGQPTEDEIRQAFITKKPEDYFHSER